MTQGTTTRVAPDVCPYCQHELDTVTSAPMNPEATPSEGDITVCIECASVLIFKEDLTVRKPDATEMFWAMGMPEVLLVIGAVKAMKRGADDNLH